MILVDANLLVYAKVEELQQHDLAHAWLTDRLSDIHGVGLPWPSLLAFVRITTNPRIFESPLSPDEAWAQVEEWIALPNVFVPEPAGRHTRILASLMAVVDRHGLVPDAHLAALAIEYGLTLQTTDLDFARFPGLRWENPIAA